MGSAASSSSRISIPPTSAFQAVADGISELDIDHNRPACLDLFAGPRQPISRALEWCGWQVLALDIEIDPGHDLSHAVVQAAVQKRSKAFDVVYASPPVSTFEIVRGSAAFRTENHPSGIPTLGSESQQQVDKANELVNYAASLQRACTGHRAAFVLEAPRESFIWQQPAVKPLRDAATCDVEVDMCCYEAARIRKSRVLSSIAELRGVAATCHHVHADNEWAPSVELATGAFARRPVREEQEYTAAFAFQIALRLTAWAASLGCYKLAITLPPRPQETGDRVQALTEDGSHVRAKAMFSMGLRFGRTPPAERRRAFTTSTSAPRFYFASSRV